MLIVTADLADFNRQVDAFVGTIEQGCMDVVQQTSLDGAEHARQVGQYKDHSGANGLRASIHAWPAVRTEHGARARFGTVKRYAAMVDGGTAAHEIVPRRRRALAFEEGGEQVFTRRVQHPGTAPRPFMGPAAIKAESILRARTERLVVHAIERVGR